MRVDVLRLKHATAIVLVLAIPGASPDPAVAQPRVRWEPAAIATTLGDGQRATQDIAVSFTSSQAIARAELWVVPELRPFLSVQPSTFVNIIPGQTNTVRVHFRVAPGANPGPREGTIHVRSRTATIPAVLKVAVNVDFGGIFVAPATKVLAETSTDVLRSVSPDGATVTMTELPPELEGLSQGSILVVGVTPLTPHGLLKKVEQVTQEPDHLELQLSAATLEDVIEEGEINISERLAPPANEGGAVQAKALGLSAMASGFEVPIRNLVVHDRDGNPITLDGSLSVNPILDLNLGFSGFTINRFLYRVGTSQSLHLHADAPTGMTLDLPVEVAQYALRPVTVWCAFVPVVFVPVISFDVGLRGSTKASLQLEFDARAEYSAGVQFANGSWRDISSHSETLSGSVTPVTSATVRGYLGPRFSLLVYGVVGPYMRVDGFGEVQADLFENPWWRLWGGLEAGVGVRVRVLGRTFSFDRPALISYRVLITQAAGPFGFVSVVKDITPGAASSNPTHLTAVDDRLYFLVGDRLWMSDGTDAGTKPVIDAAGTGGQPSFRNPHFLTEANGRLYFVAYSVLSPPYGDRLWVTDGTPDGTRDVSQWLDPAEISQLTEVDGTLTYVWVDCGPGSSTCTELKPLGSRLTRGPGGFLPEFAGLTNVAGALYFVLTDTVVVNMQLHYRRQLWKNTTVVGDIPGGESNAPSEFEAVNDRLYFVANDGVNGWKLWRSDGSTIEMVPAGPGLPTGEYYANPQALTNVNGHLLFLAEGVRGLGLWTIDSLGNAREVFCNGNTSCHGSLSQLTNVDGELYFVLSYDPGHILCKYDGSSTSYLKVITPFPQFLSASAPGYLTNVGGTLFFAGDDGVSGAELWRSDGTSAGTAVVVDIAPGSASSNPTGLTDVNGRLFFVANDGLHGNELFVTHGTSAASIATVGESVISLPGGPLIPTATHSLRR